MLRPVPPHGHGERRLQLPPAKALREQVAQAVEAVAKTEEDAVDAGTLARDRIQARVWRPVTRKAELDGLRIHDLRHTAAALWIGWEPSGAKLGVLRDHGHAGSWTTDRMFPSGSLNQAPRVPPSSAMPLTVFTPGRS